MNAFLAVLIAALLFLNFANIVSSLKCITCGKYNTKDGGSITPCNSGSNTYGEMSTCQDTDKFCMKYFNEGVTVRQCIESCTEKTTTDSSIYCCQEDGCNSGFSVKPSFVSSLFLVVFFCVLLRFNPPFDV